LTTNFGTVNNPTNSTHKRKITMNIDNAKVGDIIPFMLLTRLDKLDKAFRWRDIPSNNPWRIGQIVEVNGNTLQIKDLLCDSQELASINRSYLKKLLGQADNMNLVECMGVFAAQQAALVSVQQPVKIEVRETNNKVLELNENTQYIAVDENCELFAYYESQDTAKTLKEWERYIAKEIEENEYFDLQGLRLYAKVDLEVKVKKTLEVSIS